MAAEPYKRPTKGPKYIVYGLVDPRTLIVEYTGKSSSGLKRPKLHRTPSSLRPNSIKNIWLRDLFAAGLDYDVVTLGSVEDPLAPGTLCWWWTGKNATALNDLERWWIAYGRARGQSLCNEADGGTGSPGITHTDEWKAKASDRMRVRWTDRAFREKFLAAAKEYHNRPEVKAETSARTTAYNNQPEVLLAASVRLRENPLIPPGEAGFAMRSVNSKRAWENPAYRAAHSDNNNPLRRPEVVARMFGDTNPAKTDEARDKLRGAWDDERRGAQAVRFAEVKRRVLEAEKVTWKSECGTNTGYNRARRAIRAGEENCGPCDECKRAAATYAAEGHKRRAEKKKTTPTRQDQ